MLPLLVTAALLVTAGAARLLPAQSAADTAAVLAAVATEVRPAGAGAPAGIWFVSAGDSLTARVAAVFGHSTSPLAAVPRCRWGSDPAAGAGRQTVVTLRYTAPGRALLRVAHRCAAASDRERGAGRGEEWHLERRGSAWVVSTRAEFVS